MTEKEWLAAKNPVEVWYDRRARDHRKRRLVACACARRLLPIVENDPRAFAIIEAVERYTDGPDKDGPANWRAILAARRAVREWHYATSWPRNTPMSFFDALSALDRITAGAASGVAEMFYFAQQARRGRAATPGVAEARAQTTILRDVFGNPFRPVAFNAAWRTDTAVSLALQMYESRDFDAMPILADALQDAGCDSEEVLNHCRDAKQVHVRGCWVVDLVLGKS
jgi:hypothetical protein